MAHFFFGHVFGDGEFLDQEVLSKIQHLPLPEREVLIAPQVDQIPQNFRNLIDRTGFYFFHIFPVTAVPGLAVNLYVFFGKDAEDFGDFLFVDDAPQPHGLGIFRGNHDGHVFINNSQNIEISLAPGNHLALDIFDYPHPMRRIDGFVPHFKHIPAPYIQVYKNFNTAQPHRQLLFGFPQVGRKGLKIK
jgi:hypothetical protein